MLAIYSSYKLLYFNHTAHDTYKYMRMYRPGVNNKGHLPGDRFISEDPKAFTEGCGN